MAARDVLQTRVVDNGDTTVTVYFLTPGGREGHLVIERHMRESPFFPIMLRQRAQHLDNTAAILAVANVKQLED